MDPGAGCPIKYGSQAADGGFFALYLEYFGSDNYRIFFDAANLGGASNIVTFTNDWTHVALSFDGSTLTFYFDGVPAGSIPLTLATASSAVVFGQGVFCCSGPMNGLLDEVRIWNVARTQTEIADNMNTELSGNESGLVGYYKFDDSSKPGSECTANTNTGCVFGATIVSESPLVTNAACSGGGGVPEADVQGNSVSISDGDTTPDTGDDTDFGNVNVNSGTKQNTFTIQNTGTGNLRITDITSTDAQFAISGISLPAVIGGNNSTTFEVTFDPAATGTQSATINLAVANECEQYDFVVQGTGTSAPAAREMDVQGNGNSIAADDNLPSSADDTDFGSANVSGSTVSHTFTIENSGGADLNLTGTPKVSISGTHASDFTVMVQPSSPVSSGGGTTTFIIEFDPSAAGLRTAMVSIDNDDSDENPYNYSIQGTGGDTPPPPPSKGFVFLGNNFVNLDRHGVSEGNIFSNGSIQLKKGKPSTLAGNLTAVDDIIIHTKNIVNGSVLAGEEVTVERGATINGSIDENAGVTPQSLPNLSFTAGGDNYTVLQNGSLVLLPGSYGTVVIGKNATLYLSAGDYYFNTLDTGAKSELSMDVSGGAINVNVVNSLDFDKQMKVVTSSGDDGSSEVNFTTLQESRLMIGEKAWVLGTIVASDAAVTVGKNSRFRGSICADEITVLQGAVFQPHASSILLASIASDADVEDIDASAGSATEEQITEAASSRITDYALAQNYPNPFNPTTVISFQLPEESDVTLAIYNIYGQLVKQVASGTFASGRHNIVWDATDAHGARVASGVYLYMIKAGSFTAQRRLVLMK